MDIKNIFDFDSKTEFLSNNLNLNIDSQLETQSDILDSSIANGNFSIIEDNLNKLYENFRVLEEIIDYAKIYVNNEIDETITECRSLLSEIETMNDLSFSDNKNYISINVPLINNNVAKHMDRDGSSLKTCETYNGLISLSGEMKNNINPSTVSIKRSEQVYDHNQSDLINKKVYRTRYLLDSVAKNGAIEEITFNFKNTVEINTINFKLSNCSIFGITYIYEDNTESFSQDIATGVIAAKKIKGLKLSICCKSYSTEYISLSSNTNNTDTITTALKNLNQTIKEREDSLSSKEHKIDFCDKLENIYMKGE